MRCTQVGQQGTHAIHEEGTGDAVEEVDEGAAEVDGEDEHQVHDRQEQGDAPDTAQDHAVDAVGQGVVHPAPLAGYPPGQGMGMPEPGIGDVNIRRFPGPVPDQLPPMFGPLQELGIRQGLGGGIPSNSLSASQRLLARSAWSLK